MIPLVLLAAVLPTPAAQPRLADVLHNVLGNCRMPADGSVIICGARNADSPYRLPASVRDPGFDVDGAVDSVSRERHKLMDVGDAGTGSCSNVGARGWTGCMVKGWQADDQQRGFRPAGQYKK
jgi:hypothetical protein